MSFVSVKAAASDCKRVANGRLMGDYGGHCSNSLDSFERNTTDCSTLSMNSVFLLRVIHVVTICLFSRITRLYVIL